MNWLAKLRNRPKKFGLGELCWRTDTSADTTMGTPKARAKNNNGRTDNVELSQPAATALVDDETLHYVSDSSAKQFAESFKPDYLRYARPRTPWSALLSIWIVLAAILAGVVWMAFATIDSQVITRGVVEPVMRKTVVQSFHSGVLQAIEVNIGERVLKGQLLATIKNETTMADLESIRFKVTSISARIRRMSAELSFQMPRRFSADEGMDQIERSVFDANKLAHHNALAIFDAQSESINSALEAHSIEVETMQVQLKYLGDLSKLREDLFNKEKESFRRDGPRRVEFLQAKSAEADGLRRAHRLQTEMLTLRQKLHETKQKRAQYLSQRRAKLSKELEESAIKLRNAQKQIAKYEEARRLVRLVAPFDGIITSVSQKAPGTLVESGEVMIAMIPKKARLRAAVDIMPRDVSRVYVGAPASIKLDSLPFDRHGILRGRVELITKDLQEKNVTGQRDTVFRGWISIDKDELRERPKFFVVHPGITLEASIKTDERTILSYLIYPITRGLSKSLIEP